MVGPARPFRILVAEDEPFIATFLEEVVLESGAECVGPFATLASTLAAASSEPLDIALLDVGLRDYDSYPVAAVLEAGHIPFAFVTGYPRSELDGNWSDRPYL